MTAIENQKSDFSDISIWNYGPNIVPILWSYTYIIIFWCDL